MAFKESNITAAMAFTPKAIPSKDTIFAGWISGNPEDASLLRRLGVQGPMEYHAHSFAFVNCRINLETHNRLTREFPSYWSLAFTAINSEGQPLPNEQQYLWYEGLKQLEGK